MTDPLRFPHSNAYIDLNGDGNADILATGEKHFHLWKSGASKTENYFRKYVKQSILQDYF